LNIRCTELFKIYRLCIGISPTKQAVDNFWHYWYFADQVLAFYRPGVGISPTDYWYFTDRDGHICAKIKAKLRGK
jgi:hypothetical protein